MRTHDLSLTLTYMCITNRQELRVDRGGKTTVWCMHQYRRMFSGCKTPGEHMDQLNDYFKLGENVHK